MNPNLWTRLAASALLLLAASALDAQAAANNGAFGFGYAANAPQELVGGAVWGLVPGLGGWGLYVDAKMDPDDPSSDPYFDPDVTAAEVGTLYPQDEELTQEERWYSFNVALMKSVTTELILYAGGGYATRDVYRQYLDPQQNRGRLGFYWVADPAVSGGEVNVLAGALLRISERFRLQFGGETAPKGFTVGVSIMFGGW
jgi:hypothetical protein